MRARQRKKLKKRQTLVWDSILIPKPAAARPFTVKEMQRFRRLCLDILKAGPGKVGISVSVLY